MKTKKNIFTLYFLFLLFQLNAQEIVYKPINPSFLGGNPFNATWLLNQANSQNKFKEEGFTKDKKSELDKFSESLNRQLLNQISRDLFKDKFGDEGIQVGTFTFGNLVVEISPTSEGMSFNIFDITTGEQTTIIIPN